MDAALNNTSLIRDFPSLIVTSTSERSYADAETLHWANLRKGDRVALNSIFDKHINSLYSYGNGITKDRALIADCIQDVFFELWTKRERLASDVKVVKFYLLKSLRRKILRRLSQEEKFVKNTDSSNDIKNSEASIEMSMIEQQTSLEQAKDVKQAISMLSNRQQEAIHLKFFEGLSYENIASVMNVDVKAAYNLISKSILTLRKSLAKSAVKRGTMSINS